MRQIITKSDKSLWQNAPVQIVKNPIYIEDLKVLVALLCFTFRALCFLFLLCYLQLNLKKSPIFLQVP